mgnify:CR=1 FL=1
MQKSSWHYWQQWRQRFPLQRDVHFDQGILSNDYCRDCRYCCGPQDCATPFPMKLLPSQQHDHLERDFFLLAPDTACLDDRGCKSCGPEGCLLPRQRRPVACSLFPLVLLDTGLYLYKICPAVFFLPLCTIFIFRNIMQGCGYGFLPMMGGVSELIARLIVSMAAMKLLSYPLACFADPAAWIAAAVFTGVSYLFVIKKIGRELKEKTT